MSQSNILETVLTAKSSTNVEERKIVPNQGSLDYYCKMMILTMICRRNISSLATTNYVCFWFI